MKTRRKKTPTKTPKAVTGPVSMPPLVPQPNGRGAIYQGGIPGNAGGTGRPKSEVREAALQGADLAIPKLIAIVQNEDLMRRRPNAVTEAADKLLKYGLGTQKEVSIDDIKHRLARTLGVLKEELSPDVLTVVLSRIRPIWAP